MEIKVDQVWVFRIDGETRRMRVAHIHQDLVTLVDADPKPGAPGHALATSPDSLRRSAVPEDADG